MDSKIRICSTIEKRSSHTGVARHPDVVAICYQKITEEEILRKRSDVYDHKAITVTSTHNTSGAVDYYPLSVISIIDEHCSYTLGLVS